MGFNCILFIFEYNVYKIGVWMVKICDLFFVKLFWYIKYSVIILSDFYVYIYVEYFVISDLWWIIVLVIIIGYVIIM